MILDKFYSYYLYPSSPLSYSVFRSDFELSCHGPKISGDLQILLITSYVQSNLVQAESEYSSRREPGQSMDTRTIQASISLSAEV